MLSRNAFNALLKTLEEPPPHVKFIFATTEVDKLPVTVLSRCQRFDLRRIPTPMLQQHFASICGKEGVEAEDEALAMIAGAAEGSVRDGLSILDQAIAHADFEKDGAEGGKVVAERVRDMLGLADKGAQRDLFAALLAGDAPSLLERIDAQYALGVEPLALLRTLLELVNRITVAQVGGSGADAPTAEERAVIEQWAQGLGPAKLHRLWQLLLKGYDEVRGAPDPLIAAQMALLRVMHAADMPDPGALAKKLDDMLARGIAPTVQDGGEGAPGPSAAATPDWEALVARVDAAGHLRVAQIMRDWIRVIDLMPGRLVYSLAPGIALDPAAELRDALLKATGERWQVEQGVGEGAPSLLEREEARKADAADALLRDPLVAAALAAFPQAQIVEENGVSAARDQHWSKRA